MGNFTTTLKTPDEKQEIKHGIIIVATGSKEYVTNEYLFGKDNRIVTQRELEKRITMNKFDINDNENIVMIQCVSSRDDNHPYCSRVCCSEAIKNAIKIKEKNKNVNVYILYRDIRTYGFKEDYYQKARELGVIFIRYTPEKIPQIKHVKDKLMITVLDPILNEKIEIDSRFVVLSVGMVPRKGNEQLSKFLKVPLNEDGFFLEAHMKLRPVDFATDGVFLAGTAHAPKFIDESISQAYAAVSRASIILSKDLLEIPGTVARIDKYRCSGCGQCEEVCTYHAIEMVKEKVDGVDKIVAKVNEGLCKGCGICAGSCRSCAIQHQGFKDKQILAMIKTFEK
jgi:heterodisulfide reductase subunit A